ncbi:hypothetical protein HY638_04580 [Candidatus Woesearchaeota archaeon]|nr:hypothetical protein [Candidatus Woesearchaeota archaeon]
MKGRTNLVLVFIFVQLVFLFYGVLNGNYWFIPENILFVISNLLILRFYERVRMNYALTAALNAFFILHSAGIFGLYGREFSFIMFDKVVHFYAFVVASILFYRVLEKSTSISKPSLIAVVILISVGAGAFTEMIEYTSYLLLGQGDGFFFYGSGDWSEKVRGGSWGDSMTDLMANVLGSAAGVLIMFVFKRMKIKRFL